jgi:eukaryotic-like serine/threonine-protein kinase
VSTADDITRAEGTGGAEAFDADRIGPYRLVRELGRGGMGTVYLGVRSDDEFQKRVAVKVLRRGMDSDAIVRRFRQERQILASLQHPYIASLLDGGTTQDGLPYFAMEYVEGQPMAAYCDARNLNVSARLEIFRKVCVAVQYAHQNLIIHRDIKPANVLVTADGTPKLLDFGIAKLLNPEIGGQTLAPTAAGLQLMTPEYASPEQVRGEVVSTASDVYALGVLLYELLTGRRPYRITSRAPADVARVICYEVPIRPSTVVTQLPDDGASSALSTQGSDGGSAPDPYAHQPLPLRATPARAERLRRRLSGDLDNIVLKALSKEPERRYASVDQFSEDILRHLTGLPVIARKDTVFYRAAKFARRNRVALIATSLAFAALIAAVVVTTWQARIASRERLRAEQRFDDVRQLANAYLFELHDAIRDLPGSTPARQLLVSRGLQYLDKLAADATDRADLSSEIAAAYIRFGDVQGRPLNPNLGDTAGAMASYKKAIALYESLRGDDVAPQQRRDLAAAYLRLAAVHSASGDTAQALVVTRQGLDTLRPLDGGATTPADIRRELVMAQSALGDLLSQTGDTSGALDQRRTVLATMEMLAAEEPSNLNNLRQLAIAYQKIGNSLGNPNYPNIGDYKSALDYLQKSGEALRRGATLYPSNSMFRRNLAVVESNTADVLSALQRFDEAVARQRQALAVFQELSDADPANVAARNDVAISTFKVAQLLEQSGRLEEAVREYERALATHETLAAADPANEEMKEQVASSSSGLGTAEAKLGRRWSALAHHARAVSLSRELDASNPGNVELRVAVALSLIERGSSLARFAEREAAARDYAEAVDILEALRAKGVIEGTDLKTLEDARAELTKLR